MTTVRPNAAIATELWHGAILKGGATVSVVVGDVIPTKGYLVAIKEFEHVIPADRLVSQAVPEWVPTVRSRATLPGHFLGIWHDRETGIAYADVVRFFAERAAAEQFGREQGQIAIYDLTHDAEIRLTPPFRPYDTSVSVETPIGDPYGNTLD